jgi:excisionase family DNA binding protein
MRNNNAIFLGVDSKDSSNVDACDEQSSKPGYFWTTTEVAQLRRLCEAGAARSEVIRALAGRSVVAIQQKAIEIGVEYPWMVGTLATNPEITQAIRNRLSVDCSAGAIKALSEELDRPAWWISRKAGQLGLVKPRLKEADWSQNEFYLLEEYGEEGAQAVQRQLRLAGFERTVASVGVMLKRKQIERMATPSMSARAVSEMMGVDGKTVVRWIESRALKARRIGATWQIGKRDLRRWLIANPVSFDLKKVRQEWFMAIMRNDA